MHSRHIVHSYLCACGLFDERCIVKNAGKPPHIFSFWWHVLGVSLFLLHTHTCCFSEWIVLIYQSFDSWLVDNIVFFSVLWVMNVTFHFASMTYANEINVFSTKIKLHCQIYSKLIVSEAIIFWRKGCVCSECHHSLKCQCWIHNMKWEIISGGTDSRTETHEFPKMKAVTKHSWGGQSTLLAEVIKTCPNHFQSLGFCINRQKAFSVSSFIRVWPVICVLQG